MRSPVAAKVHSLRESRFYFLFPLIVNGFTRLTGGRCLISYAISGLQEHNVLSDSRCVQLHGVCN